MTLKPYQFGTCWTFSAVNALQFLNQSKIPENLCNNSKFAFSTLFTVKKGLFQILTIAGS